MFLKCYKSSKNGAPRVSEALKNGERYYMNNEFIYKKLDKILHPTTIIVCLQNGFGTEPIFAKYYPNNTVIGGYHTVNNGQRSVKSPPDGAHDVEVDRPGRRLRKN